MLAELGYSPEALQSLLATGAVQAVALFTAPVYTRALGPAAYGVLAAVSGDRAELLFHSTSPADKAVRSPLLTFSGVASNFAGVPLAFAFIALDTADVHDLGCLATPVGDDLTDLFLTDEAPLDALRVAGVAGQQQHVALADQLLGARLIEDHPAVGERRRPPLPATGALVELRRRARPRRAFRRA